jgi:hypothetical protein
MLLDLVVTEEQNGAPEPSADATLAIRNSGIELVSGELTAGVNTVRADFIEQQALLSFVGNDVHVIRVDAADSVARADAWMDWRAAFPAQGGQVITGSCEIQRIARAARDARPIRSRERDVSRWFVTAASECVCFGIGVLSILA